MSCFGHSLLCISVTASLTSSARTASPAKRSKCAHTAGKINYFCSWELPEKHKAQALCYLFSPQGIHLSGRPSHQKMIFVFVSTASNKSRMLTWIQWSGWYLRRQMDSDEWCEASVWQMFQEMHLSFTAVLAQFAVCKRIIFMRSGLGVGCGAWKKESHMFSTDWHPSWKHS